MLRHVVIMAGGYGERFWPLSTRGCPKQFLDILGTGRTLLQSAYHRARLLTDPEHIWVITSEEHAALSRAQLPEVPAQQVIGEPQRRNTAPCIALAASRIGVEGEIVILPSDHLVEDDRAFTQSLERACLYAASQGYTATIGIQPTRPETGYGYIEKGDALDHTTAGIPGAQHPGVFAVKAFREKPQRRVAEQYCADGRHLWNSGMFVWSLSQLHNLLAEHTPEIWHALAPIRSGDPYDLRSIYSTLPSISIDYALLEKTPRIAVVEAHFGWNDLGTYSAVGQHLPHDPYGNATLGRSLTVDSQGCVIYSTEDQPIITVGLQDYIVAQSAAGLLICPIAREQQVKEFLGRLQGSEPQ